MATTLRDVPLGQPRIYWWELDESSPPYFKALAAPSDDHLVTMWYTLAVVNLIDSIVVAAVFCGIALSKSARRKPFNLYLLFLMFPDFMYSFQCFLTCLLSAAKGQYWSPTMCRWQSIYLIYGTSANAWLNLVTTREVHRLLKCSRRRRRYFPPTLTTVAHQSLAVYVYSTFLALLILVQGDWLPHDVDAQFGFVCLPMQYDRSGYLFWYLLFLPCFVGLPVVYVLWVFFDIFRRGLLPATGKSREITIYFLRITFVFILMWGPPVLVYYILRGIHPWGMFTIGVWTHSQGAVSALFTLYKKDVRDALIDFLTCRWRQRNASLSQTEFRRSNDSQFRLGMSQLSLSQSMTTIVWNQQEATTTDAKVTGTAVGDTDDAENEDDEAVRKRVLLELFSRNRDDYNDASHSSGSFSELGASIDTTSHDTSSQKEESALPGSDGHLGGMVDEETGSNGSKTIENGEKHTNG